MKKNSVYTKFLFIGFCLISIAYFFPFIIPPQISSGINDLSCGYTYSFSKRFLKPFKLIGIAVDDYSLNKIPQRWPWRRSLYAQFIKLLDKEQVNTIGIDFTFEGESENKDDDRSLKETLGSVSSRVVLIYRFERGEGLPILPLSLPLSQFEELNYSLGMLNTPQDKDGKIRRLRGYVESKGNFYYSFSVMLSASFLNQKPQDIASLLPLLKDKTFFINYLLRPKDIIRVSFFDVLENLEELKQKYGQDFLKDALVLVYPEAEIFHDIHLTPLGRMPGGFLHLNGVADILSKRFIKETAVLSILFLIFSLGIISYIISHCGLISGFLFTLGILFLNFWFLILLSLKGIRFDYSRIAIFGFLFLVMGNLYKYIYFLAQLLKIKDKATIDPLRNLFTLRYFYYRLELESKKIYFHKDLFLIFLYLESFKETIEDMTLEKIRNIWQAIKPVICLKDSFWSVYSQEELVGSVVSSATKIDQIAHSLKNNLEALLWERDIKCKVRLGYSRLNKSYSVKELIYILFRELKRKKEETVLFKDSDLVNFLRSPYPDIKERVNLLESLDEDIEEKNRQLLSLIENLNKEHAGTKEAFFQIISSLVNALEARDPYTEGHSQRVCNYTLRMAERLGWTKEEKEKLKKASLLHDLGKIGIPDNILHKKGKLSEEEYDFIKKHEIIAIRILEPLKEMSEILPWILYHHERWDGKGYPHGLAGNAIPLASQLIALADAFDAITTGRDYKTALSYDEAIKEIVKSKETQFNPQLVDTFVDAIIDTQLQK